MKYISLFIFVFSLALGNIKAQEPGNFCLSQEDLALGTLINNYRLKFALDPLPVSKSLSYVAYLHVRDLYLNHPDEGDCNLHSWSENGTWKPICYPEEQSRKNSVWNKAKELTAYSGKVMEITYYENENTKADQVFEMWRLSAASAAVIVNTGKWARYDWKEMGVAIYKGYAVAWFGTSVDAHDGIKVCFSDSIITKNTVVQMDKPVNASGTISVIARKTGRFYMIYGSFDNLIQAKLKAIEYQKQGFGEVCVIEADKRFRISLMDFPDEASAKEAKNQLKSPFNSAWLLAF